MEFRRGKNHALISDIYMDKDNKYVCCASDTGTVHIFSMENNNNEDENKKSSLSAMGGMFSYFGSSFSFAQLRVGDTDCMCAIIGKKVFAISKNGTYYMSEITEGELEIKESKDLIEESETEQREL